MFSRRLNLPLRLQRVRVRLQGGAHLVGQQTRHRRQVPARPSPLQPEEDVRRRFPERLPVEGGIHPADVLEPFFAILAGRVGDGRKRRVRSGSRPRDLRRPGRLFLPTPRIEPVPQVPEAAEKEEGKQTGSFAPSRAAQPAEEHAAEEPARQSPHHAAQESARLGRGNLGRGRPRGRGRGRRCRRGRGGGRRGRRRGGAGRRRHGPRSAAAGGTAPPDPRERLRGHEQEHGGGNADGRDGERTVLHGPSRIGWRIGARYRVAPPASTLKGRGGRSPAPAARRTRGAARPDPGRSSPPRR